MSTCRSSSSISRSPASSTTGDDLDAGEARLAAVGGVEGRQAHEPVHALLGAEQAVGVLAGGPERGRLDARLLPRAGLEQLDLEAAPLGPAHQHAQDHLGPVLGVGAAGAGVDGHEGVAGVVAARRTGAPPRARRAAPRRRRSAPSARRRTRGPRRPARPAPSRSSTSACRVRNCSSLRLARACSALTLRRALLVVPEAGRAHRVLELGDAPFSPAGSKVVREQRELVADRRKALRRRL